MWQTFSLSRWRLLFAWLPVETLIRERREVYYAALRGADGMGCVDPVTAFLLTAIRDALKEIAVDSAMDYSMYSAQVRKLMIALDSDALSGSALMLRLNLKSRAAFR